MAKAIIKLLPTTLWSQKPFSSENLEIFARVNRDKYVVAREIECEGYRGEINGEAVAEEVFDLTNNPSRQDERERVYGRGRSISSGDIVEVDGVAYLCLPIGWARL